METGGKENCSEWLELVGPPPDWILTLPPPPLPAFLQLPVGNSSDATHCNSLCTPQLQTVHFVELPSQALPGGGVIDDTWLLILITSSLGVLLLGFLLALLLLKCREERIGKTVPLRLEVTTGRGTGRATPGGKKTGGRGGGGSGGLVVAGAAGGGGGPEAVLYPPPGSHPASRPLIWTTLTPRGTPRTQVFTGSHLSGFGELRPRVSSPTRIEHPNLPPLNLQGGPPPSTPALQPPATAPTLPPLSCGGLSSGSSTLARRYNM